MASIEEIGRASAVKHAPALLYAWAMVWLGHPASFLRSAVNGPRVRRFDLRCAPGWVGYRDKIACVDRDTLIQ